VPEVDEHGGLGAQLGDGGECRTRIVTGEEELPDNQLVGAGADRQELGEPLDDAQHDGF